jgi:hypothetical protein
MTGYHSDCAGTVYHISAKIREISYKGASCGSVSRVRGGGFAVDAVFAVLFPPCGVVLTPEDDEVG